MLLLDEGDWPLALVRWEAPIETADVDLFRARFQSWLRRRCRFALLNVQPAPLEPEDAPLFARRWTDALCAQIRQRCTGIACLIPDSAARASAASHYALRLERQLACPVRAFLDSDEALLWLRAQLGTTAGTEAPAGEDRHRLTLTRNPAIRRS